MKRILSILACALLFFTAQASQFQLVTDVTTLANGDEIVFGYQNDDATITKSKTAKNVCNNNKLIYFNLFSTLVTAQHRMQESEKHAK